MAPSLRRAAFALALLVVPTARAQQPSPPSPAPAQPSRTPGQERPPGQSSAPAKPPSPPQPAPRTAVQRDGGTPAPRPPGTQPPPVQRPAPAHKPSPRPAPPPPAAAPVPVPAPAKPEEPAVPPAPRKGSDTGLPLPRFAALRSDEVNLRGGPGTRYPIAWVYKRRDLPVEIEREFEVWRLIRDPEGVKGWVHAAVLTGRRSLVVTGAERAVRREPNDAAATVARLKPGVIARLRRCEAGSDWCEVQKEDYRGWMKRGEFWGSHPGEAVQ